MKKVVGIILVFFILLGSSTIYASGLPRTSLSKWYDQSFQKESARFKDATSTGALEVLSLMKDFLRESKESFTDVISSVLDDQVKRVNTSIEVEAHNLRNQIDKTVTELENSGFDEYVDKTEVEEEVRQDIEEVLANMLIE